MGATASGKLALARFYDGTENNMKKNNEYEQCTTDGKPFDGGKSKRADGQHVQHVGICPNDGSEYVRPVRDRYKCLICGVVTTMPKLCAETYAKKPDYYGTTWCCGCRGYFLVGENGNFVWLDDNTKVGT